MNSENTGMNQVSFPLVGAQPVRDSAAVPYHARWRLLEASGAAVKPGEPALAGVSVALRFGYLMLRAPGMLRLDVPLDVVEDDLSVVETLDLEGLELSVVDEGGWAAEWFSQVMGRPVRLVKVLEQG